MSLHSGARNLEDDCAVLEFGNETLIITHDMMAAGTHFRADADMADVAWKLLATNLSDLAAKGAEPLGVLLGHCLGSDDARFLEGFAEALQAFSVPLLGGDTIAVSTSGQVLGLTALGRATHTPVPSRSGAKSGDAIYVTGKLGKAMLGFEGEADHLDAFNRPIPLVAEGQALAPLVTAMMDVSDGLLLDAWRMASASCGVTFRLESAAIPIAAPSRLDDCIRWGDDYQLLFTASAEAKLPVKATRIGTVMPADKTPLALDDVMFTDAETLGYQHGS